MYFTQGRAWRHWAISERAYFGQPFAGFFFCIACFTASRQSPWILTYCGFGPGVAFFFVDDFGLFICSP
jgi:uncharacterized membrane protein YjjB (DUF3815 family)